MRLLTEEELIAVAGGSGNEGGGNGGGDNGGGDEAGDQSGCWSESYVGADGTPVVRVVCPRLNEE